MLLTWSRTALLDSRSEVFSCTDTHSFAARQGSLGCLSHEAKTDDAPEAGVGKVLLLRS